MFKILQGMIATHYVSGESMGNIILQKCLFQQPRIVGYRERCSLLSLLRKVQLLKSHQAGRATDLTDMPPKVQASTMFSEDRLSLSISSWIAGNLSSRSWKSDFSNWRIRIVIVHCIWSSELEKERRKKWWVQLSHRLHPLMAYTWCPWVEQSKAPHALSTGVTSNPLSVLIYTSQLTKKPLFCQLLVICKANMMRIKRSKVLSICWYVWYKNRPIVFLTQLLPRLWLVWEW